MCKELDKRKGSEDGGDDVVIVVIVSELSRVFNKVEDGCCGGEVKTDERSGIRVGEVIGVSKEKEIMAS